MKKYFSIVLFVVVFTAIAVAQETTEQRLMALARNEAVVSQMATRAAKTAQPQPQAISVTCDQPLFYASRSTGDIRTLCDVNGDGKADFVGKFFDIPNGSGYFVSALSSNRGGNQLFAATDAGSVFTLTDTDRNGVADPQFVRENPGLSYTERLLPLFDGTMSYVYTENSSTGRFNLYRLESTQTSVSSGDVPRYAQRIAGSVMARDGVYTIDTGMDAVRKIGFNGVGYLDNKNSSNEVLYKGGRITSIALDEKLGLMFVLHAGDCNDQLIPSVSATPAPCAAASVVVVNLNKGVMGSARVLANGPELNVYYSFTAHSMVARNGKLYVVVNSPGNNGHCILEYRYDQFKGQPVNPAVFADADLLGEWEFVGALSFFDGGPINNNVAVPVNPVNP